MTRPCRCVVASPGQSFSTRLVGAHTLRLKRLIFKPWPEARSASARGGLLEGTDARSSHLKPIGSAPCTQYETEAKFYIDVAQESEERVLVVHYEKGGLQTRSRVCRSHP